MRSLKRTRKKYKDLECKMRMRESEREKEYVCMCEREWKKEKTRIYERKKWNYEKRKYRPIYLYV